jgi:AraC-like DNA-binding protein
LDVLTDVLETLRARAACYGRVHASAPWGVSIPGSVDAAFHVVIAGSCSLLVEGEAPITLSGGDLVALPHGSAHALVDTVGSAPRRLDELLCKRESRGASHVRIGGEGADTTLVCGRIVLEDRANHPLLSALPKVITLRDEASRVIDWLEPTLSFLAAEAASTRPGAQTVVSRLADILFIQIVRGYLASVPRDETGWLSSLQDPQIGSALGAIHRSPERGWTVQTLAESVAMSRSAFASRFARLVGEPPLHYLTRWRMQKACSLLRDGRATLAEVAQSVGYDSEAAFSKAFKRAVGSAPGAYRRASRGSGVEVAAA